MDLINNSGETQKEEAFENNEAKKEEHAIFELTDESLEENYPNSENKKPEHQKDFLEKLHLRNHELNSVETIHELFRQEIPEIENDTDLLPEEDEYLFNEVQKAVAEKYIIDLRANLNALSKTVSSCQLNAEDIEKYLDHDMDPLEYELIQSELQSDVNLAGEIDLFREINEAIGEKDIMQLRSDLRAVILTETSYSRSPEEIEDYISGELDESIINSFEDEIINNQNLASEVKLFKEIDDAIGEKDVMELRSSLKEMDKDAYRPEMRGIRNIPFLKLNKRFWYAAAASIIVLIGINVFFYNYSISSQKIYTEFYQLPEISSGTRRSAMNTNEIMINQALTKLSIKENEQALELFSDILVKDNKNSAVNFYIGTIYQAQGQYPLAVQSYKKVTEEGDNLFIEQADWYLGLCYLKMDQRDKAIGQFNKISHGKGYYCQQSISILEKMD